jgi:sulfite reductase beta subunit-like hemoprotein
MRWLGVNGAVTLAGLILLGIPARGRRRRFLLGLVFVLVVGGCFSGCGGGGGSVITIPGTTAGDYTFTVTGTSQGISINGTVIVTIQ